MATSAERSVGLDLAALDAITEAVESGAGLPEVVRAAARALEASLVLLDRTGSVLAVAARSPADERSLLDGAAGVETIELRVADAAVGQLRMRARSQPGPALVRLVTTLVASEVERVRAPARASQEAGDGVPARDPGSRAHGRPTTIVGARDRARHRPRWPAASILVARAHAHVPVEEGWRARVLATAERGARAVVPTRDRRARRARDWPPPRSSCSCPAARTAIAKRAAEGVLRELQAGLPGHTFAIGRSRVALDPLDLHRAGNEALLAANVAEGDEDRPLLAFEQTGAYRLLLSAMSEDPAELQRFYAETVEPLVAYDEQYETELVRDRRGVPRQRRQRRRHRAEALHPPPHDPLPPRAGARAVGPRRRLDGRPREALARPEGDARARRRRARRPGDGARRRRRARAEALTGDHPRRRRTNYDPAPNADRDPHRVGHLRAAGHRGRRRARARRDALRVRAGHERAFRAASRSLHVSRHRPGSRAAVQHGHPPGEHRRAARSAAPTRSWPSRSAARSTRTSRSAASSSSTTCTSSPTACPTARSARCTPSPARRAAGTGSTSARSPSTCARRCWRAREEAGNHVVDGGCYGHVDGPRFNTKTEIRMLQNCGVTVVSQTAGPETVLAGEAEIPYALLGYATDYANGVKAEATPVEELIRLIGASGATFASTLAAAVPNIEADKLEPVGTFFRFD